MKAKQLASYFLFSIIILVHTQCSKTADVTATTTLDTYNAKAVGASAREILSTDKTNLLLEINYMQGYEPDSLAINALFNFLNTYTRKTNFQILKKQIPATGKDSLTLTDIDKIERANRTTFNTADRVSIYLLMVDSRYSPNNTLGAAYRNTSVVLFGKTIYQFSGGINQVSRYKLETTTLDHEFGHLFGLVNIGSPMQTPHEDAPLHKAHCTNSACLMYYQTETGGIGGILNNIPAPDQNCHNDLIANGGK